MDTISTKKTLTLHSIDELNRESEELVLKAMLLHPDVPFANLAVLAMELADEEFLSDLDKHLRSAYFLRTARLIRARESQAKRESDWLFPEIREAVLKLPARVPIGEGRAIPRGELRFADTTRYLTVLNKQHRQSRNKNAKRIAIMAIRKLWPRSKRASRTLTLAEVDALRAKKPPKEKTK